jgi:hypothetical protein
MISPGAAPSAAYLKFLRAGGEFGSGTSNREAALALVSLPVPITFRSSRNILAAMVRELRKVGTGVLFNRGFKEHDREGQTSNAPTEYQRIGSLKSIR